VTVNVAVVAPAVTTTLAGTVADAVLLLDRVTVLCAAVPAAAAFNVIVAVEFVVPPFTLVGLRATDRTQRGLTVSGAVADPFIVAVMTGLATAVTM